LMLDQTQLINECHITHITSIRALTTMYALMGFQTAPYTESLITHFTSIRVLTTTYALMGYQIALLIECLTTHFTSKGRSPICVRRWVIRLFF
jgi:hypothetical protein